MFSSPFSVCVFFCQKSVHELKRKVNCWLSWTVLINNFGKKKVELPKTISLPMYYQCPDNYEAESIFTFANSSSTAIAAICLTNPSKLAIWQLLCHLHAADQSSLIQCFGGSSKEVAYCYHRNHSPQCFIAVAVAASPQSVMHCSSSAQCLSCTHCWFNYTIITNTIFCDNIMMQYCSRGYKSVKMGTRKLIYCLELRVVQQGYKASLCWSSLDSY